MNTTTTSAHPTPGHPPTVAFEVHVPERDLDDLRNRLQHPALVSGWTMARTARAYDTLMRNLGYKRYGAHGADGGAMIGRELAMLAPEGFLGAHVLQLFAFPSGDPAEFETMSPADHAALEFAGWFQTVNGFADMNAKRPLTIAAALSDSPVGPLAYNELFLRYYTEKDVAARVNHGPIGLAVFADDFRSMRSFAERDTRTLCHGQSMPEGVTLRRWRLPTNWPTQYEHSSNRR